MNSAIWIFFCLTFAVFISVSLQTYIGEAATCYGSTCPVGTARCKKHMKSTSDGFIQITINCLDDYDGSLKEYYIENPTPLGPYTKYESTSYSDIGANVVRQPYRSNNEAADLIGYGY